MNFRFAVQVLSESVGKTLMYLIDIDPLFRKASAIAELCIIINLKLDILNNL